MPNDAKLGLSVGVALVIAVAVIFFRKDLSGPAKPTDPSTTIYKAVALPTPAPNTSPIENDKE